MNSEITLKVNGKEYSGWKELELTQSIDQLASSFAFSYTEKYPGQISSFDFGMGQEAIVQINKNRLITGYIEEIDKSYDAHNHVLQIRGRDRLGDLVDCSYWNEGKSGELKGQTVQNIIKALVAGFDIDVKMDDSVSSILTEKEDFSVKEGDTIIDSLMRLARKYSFLPVSYGDGKLTITRVAQNRKATTAIQSGVNVLAGSSSQSNIERFQYYIVKGSSIGDPLFGIEETNSPAQKAQDTLIRRYRPIVIIHEEKTDSGRCKKRAEWESMVRAGKSRSYRYSVQGWLQKDGTPWPLNAMYAVKDDVINVNETLLSSSVSFKLNSNFGKTTDLILVDPKTYELIGQPDKITGSNDLSALIDG